MPNPSSNCLIRLIESDLRQGVRPDGGVPMADRPPTEAVRASGDLVA